MVVVYGKEYFGLVDRVPGEYHVATLFRHVQYFPLIPVGSFIVLEDENGKDTGDYRPIPLQAKSVALAYVRALLVMVALFSGLMGGAMAVAYFSGNKDALGFFGAILATAGLVWAATAPRGWLFLPAQMAFHGLSLIAVVARFTVAPSPGPFGAVRVREQGYWIALLIANVAVLAYALTRLATHASADRAEELDELLQEEQEATFEVVRGDRR